MQAIAISNQKGGTGKSTSARNLGYLLAAAGRRVLLVDLDPQGSLTAFCGVDNPAASLADVLGGAQPGRLAMADVLVDLGGGLWLVPSDGSLADAEIGMVQRLGRESVLKRALAGVAARFDVCVMDFPTSRGLLMVSGLVAADGVLIPSQPTGADLRGIRSFLDTIDLVKAELNPGLSLIGVVVTQYSGNLNHHRAAVEAITGAGLAIVGCIGRSVKVAESVAAGQPLALYDPGNPRAQEYQRLTEHVLLWLNKT